MINCRPHDGGRRNFLDPRRSGAATTSPAGRAAELVTDKIPESESVVAKEGVTLDGREALPLLRVSQCTAVRSVKKLPLVLPASRSGVVSGAVETSPGVGGVGTIASGASWTVDSRSSRASAMALLLAAILSCSFRCSDSLATLVACLCWDPQFTAGVP